MTEMNIGVFKNSNTCSFHLDKFVNLKPNDWMVYSDLGHFLNSGHPKNIAVLHCPYPFSPDFTDLVNQLVSRCNKVFIIITEVHQRSVEFMTSMDKENIVFFIAGTINQPLVNATVKYYFDWFHTSRYFYKEYLPEILQRINYSTPKRFPFEILLGRKKLHRDCVYNHVKSTFNEQDYVMRYFNDPDKKYIGKDQDLWISETAGLAVDRPLEWTVDFVKYYGHTMSVSQVIPITLYNRTNFSIVAETNWASYYTFFTEKTVKPIIGKRLFIMVAGKGYLKTLRELGFKTFDGIIDESYDNEPDDLIRFEAACKQARWLCDQDQRDILNRIQPIVEHNFNLMMTRDWHGEFIREFESIVDSVVQQT